MFKSLFYVVRKHKWGVRCSWRCPRYTHDTLTSPSGKHIESAALSSVWVFQWLDDVGLPQYKEAFYEARIDPRVLDVLTWDDLAFLKINSLLHAISLKRGVQVSEFSPGYLRVAHCRHSVVPLPNSRRDMSTFTR